MSIELVDKASNNLLEHMEEITCTWIDMISGVMSKFDCCLSFGDNASSLSWLHLTRFFMIGHEAHEETSNKIDNLCIDHTSCIYGQHFKGKHNWVADSLSRDHHLPKEALTQLLNLFCLEQIPKNFLICPVLQEVVS